MDGEALHRYALSLSREDRSRWIRTLSAEEHKALTQYVLSYRADIRRDLEALKERIGLLENLVKEIRAKEKIR